MFGHMENAAHSDRSGCTVLLLWWLHLTQVRQPEFHAGDDKVQKRIRGGWGGGGVFAYHSTQNTTKHSYHKEHWRLHPQPPGYTADHTFGTRSSCSLHTGLGPGIRIPHTLKYHAALFIVQMS